MKNGSSLLLKSHLNKNNYVKIWQIHLKAITLCTNIMLLKISTIVDMGNSW